MNRFRHIGKVRRWPDRFIVFGDAALHANPFYGQGMSLSTLQAVALDTCLTEKIQPLPQTFHKMQAKAVAGAWMLATSYDYRVPGCDGGPAPFYQRMMHKHIERVLKLVTKDVYAASTMASVLHLVKPPTALIAPRMLLKTITA
jgi:2-polyprenyl-6-methoxyphenol hydroxylase-like FAD-dependent oxidoreductase